MVCQQIHGIIISVGATQGPFLNLKTDHYFFRYRLTQSFQAPEA